MRRSFRESENSGSRTCGGCWAIGSGRSSTWTSASWRRWVGSRLRSGSCLGGSAAAEGITAPCSAPPAASRGRSCTRTASADSAARSARRGGRASSGSSTPGRGDSSAGGRSAGSASSAKPAKVAGTGPASKTGSTTGQARKPQSVFDPHDHYNNTIQRGDRESPPFFVIMFLVACLAGFARVLGWFH